MATQGHSSDFFQLKLYKILSKSGIIYSFFKKLTTFMLLLYVLNLKILIIFYMC